MFNGFLIVMLLNIKTLLLPMTPPIPHLKRPPSLVSECTTTFMNMYNLLSKRKLLLHKLSTPPLLFMKLIMLLLCTTGLKFYLPRHWKNSLAVRVRFKVMDLTIGENLKVVQHLIPKIWSLIIRRGELAVDPMIGFSRGSFVLYLYKYFRHSFFPSDYPHKTSIVES